MGQQQRATSRGREAEIRREGERGKRELSYRTTEETLKRVRVGPGSVETPSATVTPVIKKLDAKEARDALAAFKESVNEWASRCGLDEAVMPSSTAGATDKRSARLQQTKEIIDEMEDNDWEDSTIYACQVNDITIGMLSLDDNNPPYVSVLLAHPESKRVGITLLEQAVNASEESDRQGRLEASAANDNALGFFRKAGFVETGDTMTFDPRDPANKDKWSRNENGKWRFSDRSEVKYPVNFDA